MLNEKDIHEICSKICAKAGYDFTIPVFINKRLTRTLGRVFWERTIFSGVVSIKMEISYNFLKCATLESIIDVLKHECCHYLVVEETHEAHGHDKVFKEMCARIGCTNNKTYYDAFELKTPEERMYKYFVVCKDCGEVIYKYHRAGKVIKNLDMYICPSCGGDLKIVQNY